MSAEFPERSAAEFRKKFDEMRARAEMARSTGDQRSERSYGKLALGWAELIKHAERRTAGAKSITKPTVISNALDAKLIDAVPAD